MKAQTPTTWFISRHPGARQWADRHGVAYDRHTKHLPIEQVKSGDCVIGSLPVSMAAQVCVRGASYYHLTIDLPPELRGRELSVDQLDRLGASLQKFEVHPVYSDGICGQS